MLTGLFRGLHKDNGFRRTEHRNFPPVSNFEPLFCSQLKCYLNIDFFYPEHENAFIT